MRTGLDSRNEGVGLDSRTGGVRPADGARAMPAVCAKSDEAKAEDVAKRRTSIMCVDRERAKFKFV